MCVMVPTYKVKATLAKIFTYPKFWRSLFGFCLFNIKIQFLYSSSFQISHFSKYHLIPLPPAKNPNQITKKKKIAYYVQAMYVNCVAWSKLKEIWIWFHR